METRTQVRAHRGVVAFLVCAMLLAFLAVLSPFLKPIAWSAVIVVTSWPLYRRLRSALSQNSLAASLLMTILVATVIGLAVAPILVGLAREVESSLRALREQLMHDELNLPFEKIPVIGAKFDSDFNALVSDKAALADMFSSYRDRVTGILAIAAKGALSSLFTFIGTLFVSFFFFRDGEILVLRLKQALLHIGGQRMEEIVRATHATLQGAVYGMLMTALVQGVLAGIGYYVAGAPVPLLLGFATMILSFIPFGTPLIYLPAALIVAMNGNVIAGALLAGWGVGVVSVADNFLRPYFLSQSTQMPIALSVMGVLGGIMTFGLLGLFLGPVIVAIVLVLWREWLFHEEPLQAQV